MLDSAFHRLCLLGPDLVETMLFHASFEKPLRRDRLRIARFHRLQLRFVAVGRIARGQEWECRRNAGDETKWGPASLPAPTIRFCPALPPAPSRPAVLRSANRQTRRRDARRNNPATVRSAPLRGPASPEGPSSSRPASAEAVAFPERWSAFQSPDRVRFNSWEYPRSVIGLSVVSSSDPSVSVRLVLQPVFPSRRSDVSVVR